METCRWIRFVSVGEEVWETKCDQYHLFHEGGPEDNFYKFCPYCGRLINEVK